MPPTRDGHPTPAGRHVDEGELHTFLDEAMEVLEVRRAREVRAHLDTCPVCRDRLAVEAAVRDRSVGLLSLDDPSTLVSLPTFDELRHQAGSTDAGPGAAAGGRRAIPRSALAWAATVALSLGVGWGVGVFGPEGLRPGAVLPPPAAAPAPAMVAPEPSSVPSSTPVRVAETEADEADEADEAAPVAPPPAATPAPEPEPPVSVPVSVPAPEPAPASSSAPPVSTPPVSTPAVSTPAMNALARRMETRFFDTAAVRAAVRVDSVPSSIPFRARSVDPTEPLPLLRATPDVRRIQTAPRASADELRAVLLGDAVAAPAPPAEPSSAVGLVLPGLTLEEVRWTEVWPGQEGVVAPQVLPDGRRVELRVAGTPVGGEARVEPPARWADAPSGWSRAVRVVDGGWMVLDGPLAVEALEVLLATAR